MTKSSNKGETVGEKYSGIEFLQTPGRTPAFYLEINTNTSLVQRSVALTKILHKNPLTILALEGGGKSKLRDNDGG